MPAARCRRCAAIRPRRGAGSRPRRGPGREGGGVGEVDVLEDDPPPGVLQLDSTGTLLHVRHQVKVLEDAVEDGEGPLHVDVDVGQLAHGAVEVAQVGDEGQHGADGQGPEDGLPPPVPEDEGRPDAAHHADEEEEPAPHHGGADLELHQIHVEALKLGQLVRLAPEDAGQDVPADAEALLEVGRQLRLLLLRLAGDLVAEAPHPAHGEDDDGDGHDGDQGQAPVQEEDGGEGEGDHGHVLGDAGQGPGDDVLHPGDVVVDPAHDLPGLGHGVEAQGLALQVGEELQAQVGHDGLPDAVVEVLLQDADQAGHDGGHDEARHEPVELREVAVGYGLVHDPPDKEGREEAQEGGAGDAEQDAGRHPEVRPEVGHHPAQLGEAHLGAGPVPVAVAHPVQPVG